MKRYFKSEFARNVLTLMTGTTIAQALPIAISPILTRIYTPNDFGILALFVSLSTIFGTIANARYELAIVLPEEDADAINIVALGMIITTSLSLVLLIAVILFNDFFATTLGNPEISLWLYFVPLTVLFIGFYNVLNYYNTRIKEFKTIAKANVFKAVSMSVVHVTLGFLKAAAAGLVAGQIISYLSGNLSMLKKMMGDKKILSEITVSRIKKVGKRYKDFPKFSLWGVFANVLSQNLTNIITSILFSIKSLGFYSFAIKILGVPSSLIGASIGQVYLQQATKERQETAMAVKTFNSTAKKLFVLSIPIFAVLFVVIEELFAFVFGEDWRTVGVYGRILIPLLWIRFVSTPLSLTNIVFEKQKIALVWQLGLFVLSLLIYDYVYVTECTMNEFLYIYSGCLFLYYILLLYIVNRVAKGRL